MSFFLVSHRRFELRTTWLKVKCSANWANGPGWDSRTRTYEMPESKSGALPTWRYPNMGWIVGFEPTTFSATNWRSNQLNYIHHKKMARLKRFELLTHCLEGSCSILLSYRRVHGAGDGNRTHAASLEGWNSTIELHPHVAVSVTDISYYNR